MKHKKFLFPLILLLCLVLFACGRDEGDISADSTSITTQPETSDTETTYAYDIDWFWVDPFEEIDFGGQPVQIMCWEEATYPEFYIPEQTGELINDAVFSRNRNTEDRLGVVLNFIPMPGNTRNANVFISVVEAEHNTGTAMFDIIAATSQIPPILATQGMLADLNDQEYLTFTNPWWLPALRTQAAVGDSLYFCTGDMSTNLLQTMNVIFYNRDLAAELGLGDLDALALEGKWTLNTMLTMTEGVYKDLSDVSMQDRYGFVTHDEYLEAMYLASGFSIVNTAPDGTLTLSEDYTSSRVADLIAKLSSYLTTGNEDIYLSTASISDPADAITDMVSQGQTLFMQGRFASGDAIMQKRNVSFGVLPLPKYDEQQSSYRTSADTPYAYTLYGIPSILSDERKSMSAAVLEVMAWEGYQWLKPAVYEVSQHLKYSESSKTFDLIRDGIVFDPGHLYIKYMDSTATTAFRDSILDPSVSWTDKATAIAENIRQGCAAVNEAYR